MRLLLLFSVQEEISPNQVHPRVAGHTSMLLIIFPWDIVLVMYRWVKELITDFREGFSRDEICALHSIWFITGTVTSANGELSWPDIAIGGEDAVKNL